MSVTFGILAEHNDKRVALVPKNVEKLIGLGAKGVTEHAAGQSAGVSDAMYQQAGATCTAEAEVSAKADMLLSI